MLAAVVKELEDELHKLDKPTNYQIKAKAITEVVKDTTEYAINISVNKLLTVLATEIIYSYYCFVVCLGENNNVE